VDLYSALFIVAHTEGAQVCIKIIINIKTLGVTLDANLTLNQHVSSLCKSLHFHTRALRHIRPALSDCMATTLATSIVQSRLDYANSLLHGTSAANIYKLQCAQNSSRVVLSRRHREH